MKTVCTEYFLFQFFKNVHPSGESEMPISPLFAGSASRVIWGLQSRCKQDGCTLERFAHVKYPGWPLLVPERRHRFMDQRILPEAGRS